jgi:hypothetical protein
VSHHHQLVLELKEQEAKETDVCAGCFRDATLPQLCERERRYWRIIIIIKRYNPKVALNPLRPHLHHYIITYKSFREENFLCPSVEN